MGQFVSADLEREDGRDCWIIKNPTKEFKFLNAVNNSNKKGIVCYQSRDVLSVCFNKDNALKHIKKVITQSISSGVNGIEIYEQINALCNTHCIKLRSPNIFINDMKFEPLTSKTVNFIQESLWFNGNIQSRLAFVSASDTLTFEKFVEASVVPYGIELDGITGIRIARKGYVYDIKDDLGEHTSEENRLGKVGEKMYAWIDKEPEEVTLEEMNFLMASVPDVTGGRMTVIINPPSVTSPGEQADLNTIKESAMMLLSPHFNLALALKSSDLIEGEFQIPVFVIYTNEIKSPEFVNNFNDNTKPKGDETKPTECDLYVFRKTEYFFFQKLDKVSLEKHLYKLRDMLLENKYAIKAK
jgi:hypothetical protein